jgi:hypothetical protein
MNIPPQFRRRGFLEQLRRVYYNASALSVLAVVAFFLQPVLTSPFAVFVINILAGANVLVWLASIVGAVLSIMSLYDPTGPASKSRVLLDVVLSVLSFIIGFAFLYFELSDRDSQAFSLNLSPVSAFYFSVVTFSTVGFGDITPKSNVAMLLVSGQILISHLYGVLILSAIAGFIRAEPRKV